MLLKGYSKSRERDTLKDRKLIFYLKGKDKLMKVEVMKEG